MESSHERGKVSYSSPAVSLLAFIVSSLTIIIIHGPQECQTLFHTFSVSQSHRGWNFPSTTLYTNLLLLKGPLLFHFISGSPIKMVPDNSSVVPNFAEIAWQGEQQATAGGNSSSIINDTSSSGSFEDSSESEPEEAIKVICASSTSCKSSSSAQNETRIVRKMKSEKERLRLELLKQIKSLDHMKCFPKVLCGLSVDSSKSSSGIDSHLVRSYIQLMRTAKPEDDSSEESKPSIDSTKDALSLFLMKSGILPSKNKKRKKDASISASSSEESDEDENDDPLSLEDQAQQGSSIPYKSSIERKNDQLKEFLKLSKRKLAISDGSDDSLDSFSISPPHNQSSSSYNINPLEFSHQKGYHPASESASGVGESETTSTITGQIGSLVSSWVPWVSLSFGADSFEKDPFFSGGGAKGKKTSELMSEKSQNEAWKKEFDKLTYFMKLKKEIERRKAKLKKRKLGRMADDEGDYDGLTPHQQQDEIIGGVGVDVAAGEMNNDYADYYEENADYLTANTRRLSRDLKASATDSEMVIYSTAVEIGKKLKDPRQCDYLYNGCPVPYSELLKIITSIRKDIKEEDETVEGLSKDMADYLPSKTKVSAASTQKQRVSSSSSANKIKKKTQANKPSRHNSNNNNVHHKKQQIKYNGSNGKKKQQHTQHHQQQQQQKSPITKISHTLPNGEKVEINVQLSGSGQDGFSVNAQGNEQFDQEAESQLDDFAGEEIGETDYLTDEESLFDEDDDDDDGNTLSSQGAAASEVISDLNISSPEDPAISASYELDDEKQDGDDFRKPTPLEIFNKISLKGVHDQQIPTSTTTQTPKPKYKVATKRPPTNTRRPPVSTKRPKPKPNNKPSTPKPKPMMSTTTEKKPIWSKGTTTSTTPTPKPKPTRRPSTVRTARPTPRATPPVNKLKPLMQSYIQQYHQQQSPPSSSTFASIEDDEKSMESTSTKATSKRPPQMKSKPNPNSNNNDKNKVKAPNKKASISPQHPNSQKRNDTKTSQPTHQKPNKRPSSLSPNSSSKQTSSSVSRNKNKPTTTTTTTHRPTTTKKVTPSTTPRYKVSKTIRPSSPETDTIKLSATKSSPKNNTKMPNNSSQMTNKKPSLGASSKGTGANSRKPNNNRKPTTTTTPPTPMTTPPADAPSTLPPLAMFTKSVMDDVIEEFYHKKHIPYAIPTSAESPATTIGSSSLNGHKKQKHSHKIGNNNNGIRDEDESQPVVIGSEGTSPLTSSGSADESFISIETDEVSGELKLHSGSKIKKKDQLGDSSSTSNGGSATGELSESNPPPSEAISKNKRNSGESSSSSSSESSSNKKRIKYKNPKLPHLVILNSSTLDHPNIPNPIVFSDESSSGSRKKPPSLSNSKSPGYSIANKKPTTPGTNPLDLPPYVLQPNSAEYPYWVPPPASL